MRYGIPYKGSKNKIADQIVNFISQPDKTLVDIMCGGGSITHAAMHNNLFGGYIINDISGMSNMFVDCVNGKYKNESSWISRSKFNRNNLHFAPDKYIKYLWSFGTGGEQYLYSRKDEPKIEALHDLVVNSNPAEAAKYIDQAKISQVLKAKTIRKRRLLLDDRLPHLERLERLNSISTNKKVIPYTLSYQDVPVGKDCVVYADPPYKGTSGYGVQFDHDEFWEWFRQAPFPVYVSEYTAPEDVTCVLKIDKRGGMSKPQFGLIDERIEKLYWNGVS